MIRVYELNDDNEFTEVGTVEDGEITSGEETLTTIDSEQTWTTLTEQELADRFNGPRVMATIDDDTPADDDEPVEQQASFIHISELPVTPTQLDTLVDTKEWVRYQGPQGGEGWRNTDTNEIVYDDDPPGERGDVDEADGTDLPDVEVVEFEPAAMEQSVEDFSEQYPALGAFLTEHDADELAGHDIITAEGEQAAVAVSPEGDIQNLHAFPEDAADGVGEALLREAIARGGRTLDNYDTGLTDIYRRNGFREVARMDFDPEYAPENWDFDEFGQPDVLFMTFQPQTEYETTDRYIGAGEWDDAKEDSRQRAVDDLPDPTDSEAITHMADTPTGDQTSGQDVVDSAVDRRGADWVRENISQVLTPLKLMGIDAAPEDVDIPEGDGEKEAA